MPSVKANGGREQRSQRVREDILDAAGRALLRLGAAATMADIAAEAGYTVPSLYAYFSSKEQIIDGLQASLTEGIASVFETDFPAGLTSAQRLELLLRRLFADADRRRDLIASLLALPSVQREAGFDFIRHRAARWLRENEPKLVGRSKGAAETLAVCFFGLCHAFFLRWRASGSRSLLAHDAPLVAALFLHGAAGAKPPAKGRGR